MNLLFPLYRKLCQVAILWDRVQRQLFYTSLDSESLLFQIDFNWNDGALCRTRLRFYVFLETKPSYQWCSGPLPIQGCTHTCRPCTARARHSASGRSVLHSWVPPSPLHTGISLWSRHRGCHSPGYTALHRKTEYTMWNSTFTLQLDSASRLIHCWMNIAHQLDQT